MEKEQTTETVTNIKVTLGKDRYQIFKTGIKAYQSGYNKPAKEIRSLHNKVGRALNLIENDLREAGVKQQERAKIASDNFDGMKSQDKSDYRKFATEFESMEAWCLTHYVNGYNLNSILKGYAKHERITKECQNQADNFYTIDFSQFIEPVEVFTKDKAGKVIPLEQKEVKAQEIKKGFNLDEGIGKVTLEDLKNHFVRLSNEIEKQYKAGNFTDNLTNAGYLEIIEVRLDSLNAVLKDVKIQDKLVKKAA